MEPKEGLLTYRAEGNNIPGSPYYSRKIHWPGLSSRCHAYGSGVTIGRGYDLKYRSRREIVHDLTLAGIPSEQAKKIAEAAKKSHCSASDFVKREKDHIGEITELQQLRLFELTYQKYIVDSRRFYNEYKNVTSVSWERLDSGLKDVFIDMKYQGVLTIEMVPIFGRNEKQALINLIKTTPGLSAAEPARGRVPYIQGSGK
ncbi:hypothetical protein GIX45_29250 [Erwinia sp. CPCC 100877]|nr:hypothetical protein [Erwinia sp. CPCC 100877]